MTLDPSRTPPKSLDAERTVLGSCLIDPVECIDAAAAIAPPEAFYATAHQVIFGAILDLFNAGRPVDVVAVCELMARRGTLDSVGGPGYVAKFEDYVLTTQNVTHYAEIIRDCYQRRELIQKSYEIIEDCFDQNIEQDDLMGAAERSVQSVTGLGIRPTFESIADYGPREYDALKSRSLSPNSIGLLTGLTALDKLTTGLWPGEVWTIAGKTSAGKTALGLHIGMTDATQAKKPVAFVSLEMSKQQIYYRQMAWFSRKNLFHFREGFKSRAILDDVGHDSAKAEQFPIFVDDSFAWSIPHFRAQVRALKRHHPALALIVVDYLQLMSSGRRAKANDSRQDEVSEISRQLKIAALEFEVPIIALAQLNREADKRDGPPRLSDLRESGAIEQNSDTVLFIDRDKENDRNVKPGDFAIAELNIGKQRNGPLRDLKVGFILTEQRFVNLATPQPSSGQTPAPAPAPAPARAPAPPPPSGFAPGQKPQAEPEPKPRTEQQSLPYIDPDDREPF